MDLIRETWLIAISIPIYCVIIAAEIILSNLKQRQTYTKKNTVFNVYLMSLNMGLDFGLRLFTLGILGYFFKFAVIHWQTSIVYWVLLFVFEDMMYYWLHRFDHEIRLFWAVHVTHHSSELMNFTVGFRSSVFQPVYRFIYFIPIILLGFDPLDLLFVYSATQIWGIFVHTEYINKMGWLEYILVTPSHHRVHHGSNAKYLDKNMGMFLIVWDKLFGTFQPELTPEEYEPIRYGLTKNLENPTAVTVVFHEWQQVWRDITQKGITLKDRFNYLFGPPGWSHDGSRQTSVQMREIEAAKSKG